MRTAAIILSVMLISVFAGCAVNSGNASLHLLTINDKGDRVYLDTRSLQVTDNIITATLCYDLAAPGDNGLKASRWKVQINPAERLLKILAIASYDAAGAKLPAVSMDERPETAANSGYSRYTFIAPDSPRAKEYEAIIDYCLTQKLPVNTAAPPYITAGYRFAGAYPVALLFFDPASIKTRDDSLFFTGRAVYSRDSASADGIRYENTAMEVKLAAGKYREICRTAFTADGRQISQDTGAENWQNIAPNLIVDALVEHVHEYCYDHGIKVAD